MVQILTFKIEYIWELIMLIILVIILIMFKFTSFGTVRVTDCALHIDLD